MRFIIEMGRPNGMTRIKYRTTVHYVWVGQAIRTHNAQRQGDCACIDLYYKEADFPVMVKVFREMNRRQILPAVYINRRGNISSVVVLFIFPIDPTFIRSIIGTKNFAQINHQLQGSAFEFLSIAEVELPRDDIVPFIATALSEERFYVNLSLNAISDDWSEAAESFEMTTFIDGYPTDL